MARLRRSDCSGPGLRRRRCGRGFIYLDDDGRRLHDPELLARIRELAIPPAWERVWICADPRGHLQATGIDAAGRKQYIYHPAWRARREREKFARMLRFARALPRLRRRVARELTGSEPTRERVLAGAARLLDVGLFRIGSEEYADEEGGLGLTTLHREHVSFKDGAIVFDYPAKNGIRRVHEIYDPASAQLVRALVRRREASPELLAYREGRRWAPVRADDVNGYLKQLMGEGFSAKDFRTWNATVLSAVALAADGAGAQTKAARQRAVRDAVRGVAAMLGNTPAVAQRAYIDPRVIDRYLSGWTIGGALARIGDLADVDERERERLERAVLDLLADERDSPAIERIGGRRRPGA